MARKPVDINIRIQRQGEKILEMKKDLEKAQEDYEKLLKEREEKEKEDLYAAFKKSKRSLQDVMKYLKGKLIYNPKAPNKR